jgi:hypothetical protein
MIFIFLSHIIANLWINIGLVQYVEN